MTALIELKNVTRFHRLGDETIVALNSVDLTINSGEMVAIIGASGSGKSTLMNILGCLDQPNSGSYRVDGQETAKLSLDKLASLRREHFGFIFQRYHLMADLSAAGNVEIPAIYAGIDPAVRRERSHALLGKLGLGDRIQNRPSQLSGGQQQRVSIARALMNGGHVILADEPTGALDSKSGETVLRILRELHRDGHTVIIVTHDAKIAEHADRIIEIFDGRIIADKRNAGADTSTTDIKKSGASTNAAPSLWYRVKEAVAMAYRALTAHPIRTLLTMLGIIIGVAAVVVVVGLGEGSKQKVLNQVNDLGASTIGVYPGSDWGDERASRIRTLLPEDADALSAQPYVDSVSPVISTSTTVRMDNVLLNTEVNGVGESYFQVNNLKLGRGRFFDNRDIESRLQVALIDDNTKRRLFREGVDPIGKVIMVQKLPLVITGVLAPRRSSDGSRSLQIYIPYTAMLSRLSGQASSLTGLTIRVSDRIDTRFAEGAIVNLLTRRHGLKDFFIFNSDQLRKTFENTSRSMSMLITSVAAIALVVGGIGVMNIMLVTVTERIKEIGLRMAVGARRMDIMLQFQLEAVVICIVGAVFGLCLALAIGAAMGSAEGDYPMIFTSASIIVATASAIAVGLVFGYLPARSAAQLTPVDALTRE
ncbi:MacB family efflux pump subunit [Phyllobacterium myrsinacearum]|uniref:Pyoverdine export ATP-binding/permease protein PvdT n=1 Tax=Phyllobacterium myrsinacearum TaxID=28101 RepID=A0A839EH46_9HYPH|nr:MacB family efflux pump subunit [Phyllobacterium myrsinacearum]MBA8879301.1 macrolide transport system ATP-binding/permease protein [Phyllobacterium myrsinacearum]